MSHFEGKTVLVTGAGGSIASETCQRLLDSGVSTLKALSLTEGALWNLTNRLKSDRLEPILGSVGNRRLLDKVLPGVDIVIHAAAHKHVPICEQNPSEAVLNNVFGTKTLIDASKEHGIGQFLLISTDKAVRPASIMGAAKRVCELMLHRARESREAQWITVRFGNVLNSAGSVLPLWREQIQNGGPITITDKRCERFFMSIPEACELVLESLCISSETVDGVFVFDMGEPVKILDLAVKTIADTGMECEIVFTGLRPGEKVSEELHIDGELIPTRHDKIKRVIEDFDPSSLLSLNDLQSVAENRQDESVRRILYDMAR